MKRIVIITAVIAVLASAPKSDPERVLLNRIAEDTGLAWSEILEYERDGKAQHYRVAGMTDEIYLIDVVNGYVYIKEQ